MRCEDLQRSLAGYAKGAIPPEERNAVEDHLRGCPVCRAVLTQVDSVAAVLVQTQPPAVPADLAGRVMARARQRITRPGTAWNPVQWWRAAPASMRGAAAAVLVLGLLGGWAMGRAAVHTKSGRAGVLASSRDPLDGYDVDYLDGLPQDSLAGSYLALVSPHDKEGR